MRSPCRVCGGEVEGRGRELFKPGLRPLPRRILTLFSFRVRPTDYSTLICLQCIDLINKYYAYYRKVKLAQKRFAKITKQSDTADDFNPILQAATSIPLFTEDTLSSLNTFDNFDKKNNIEYQNDLDLDCIKNEQFLNICETDTDNKTELGLILDLAIAKEVVKVSNVKTDDDTFKSSDDINSELTNVLNYHYHCDNDDTMHHDCDHFSDEIDSKQESPGESPAIEPESIEHCMPTDHNASDKNSNTQENDDDLNKLKHVDIPKDFPTEIIKDGKIVIKGDLLDDLLNRFYNIQCDICSSYPKFKNLTQLLKHYTSKHDTKGYVKCCSKKFYLHRSIYMHMAQHLQPSAFQCPICNKTVSRPHSLKLHLQTHLPEAEKPHKCEQCGKRFSYLEGLNSHKMIHIPEAERQCFNCKLCDKKFTLVASYNTHMRAIHTTAKYLCSICGRAFRRKTELTIHMFTHDTTGKHQVQCQQCGYICKNEPTLKIHMKRHSKERINCDFCDYSTHRRQQLNIHVKVHHTDLKPYVCVVCEKQFKLKSVLRTHMAQHTGEHKYACVFCPKTFASPGNYHAHRKRIHAEAHQNDRMMKHKEKFKEINPSLRMPAKDESHVHEMARQYLQEIAKQRTIKKNS